MLAHHQPDSEVLAQCADLRALQVALRLIAFHDNLGDIEGWDEGIWTMIDQLVSPSAT